MLVRCLYASRPVAKASASDLEKIVEVARKNNPAHGVTGMLCASDSLFIQVLEGGRDEVCDLYSTIVRDPRHQQVRLLVYEEITERKFGAWTMGLVSISKLNPSLVLKYFKHVELNPFECSGQATLALLTELMASASVVNRG
jgi:Sensors of blue-light using FAD